MNFVECDLLTYMLYCVCTAADFPFVAVTLFDCMCSIRPGIWEGEVRQRVWKFSVGRVGPLEETSLMKFPVLVIFCKLYCGKKAKQHFVGTVHIVCGAGSM